VNDEQTMTTPEIVAVLRHMSSDHYLGISLALRMDREQRAAWHYNADALRRAAKRLSRLGAGCGWGGR